MRPYSGTPLLLVASLFLAGSAPYSAPTEAHRGLTFAERVAAQEAIERVYYSHQIGTTLPFDAAIPRAVLERKVRTTLAQSAALEALWRTPITAAMLRAELERIVASTRFPSRLRQVSAALGDDPLLLQECLARPILAERLSRSSIARDERIHGLRDADDAAGEDVPHRGRDDWWRTARLRFEEVEVEVEAVAGEPGPRATAFLRETAGVTAAEAGPESCDADDTWNNASLDDAADGRIMIWTGTVAIVWGTPARSGAIYDPLTDTWGQTSRVGAPPETAIGVWTGTRLLVWSGEDREGGLYDPSTDLWAPISAVGSPSARGNATAVWTGTELLVWGGGESQFPFGDGRSYHPATDSWSPISLTGAPSPRLYHHAVWAGGRMIVWGGRDSTGYVNTGGRYDPVTNTWQPMSTFGAPVPRSLGAVVAAGGRMIVWGGHDDSSHVNTGGRYDPATDTWQSTSTSGAPSPRSFPSAVWTGSRLLVWGGATSGSVYLNSGGRYDPAADVWETMGSANAPSARADAHAIWTGDQMIVWQGSFPLPGFDLESGGRYDPILDAWTPMSDPSPALRRIGHTAVWTGNLMVVWGGWVETNTPYPASIAPPRTGDRYDPLTDSWAPTAPAPEPVAWSPHTAVWTGHEMIVWGDNVTGGARYDPIADSWAPLTTVGAPGLHGATAVWTGTRMLLWGDPVAPTGFAGGGSYDPFTNTWTAISTENAPSVRRGHSAVWTGSRMIIWGGRHPTVPFVNRTGGLYDPTSDSWVATEWVAPETPEGRSDHAAVWTGSEMLVWGGYTEPGFPTGPLNTGARYNPATDTWQPMALAGAPLPRWAPGAVWTGGRLIVWGGEVINNRPAPGGGRYDPALDAWEPVSDALAPPTCRYHTAVWTGGSMIVWGGDGIGQRLLCGGSYALEQSADLDGDGATWCAGDCDDTRAATYPGATEVCDGADNDCDGTATTESDADLDGWIACAGDCNEGDPLAFPGAPERCNNADDDCDAVIDAFSSACGVGACAATGTCTAGVDSCAPGPTAPETCNGIDDDCNGSVPPGEADGDADGTRACAGDCDDSDPVTYPGAPEVNDGLDNQCAGGIGFGLVDEVSGAAGFTVPSEFCWQAQAGATRYEVLRSTRGDLAAGCAWQSVPGPCWTDPLAPRAGGRFHYLVRAIAPWVGSWGAGSAGSERSGDCDGFHLLDRAADDAPAAALADFFTSTPALPTDYLHVSLSGGGQPAYEWCAQRADFYRSGYLQFAASGGTVTSEGWDIWYRHEGEAWTGPQPTFDDSVFGDQCVGPYSWCPELGLTESNIVVAPGDGAQCEAQDLLSGCGDGTWVFAVSIGPDRMTACGF